jgi:hypothetical protein
MSSVSRFLAGYDDVGYTFDRAPVERYVISQLSRAVALGFDQEASWCLWMAIQFSISIPNDVVDRIPTMQSSTVLLLGKVAHDKGLAKEPTQAVFGTVLGEDDFRSSSWLLAYEGAMRGWFGWSASQLDGSVLEPLATLGVSFLDLAAASPVAVKRKVDASVPTEGASVPKQLHNFYDVEFEDLDEYLEVESDVDEYGVTSGDDEEANEDDDDEQEEKKLD